MTRFSIWRHDPCTEEFCFTILSNKSKFNKECYLDSVIKYADRTNITRLRISAHRLEIELGRYNQTPRDDRICSWCNIVLGSSTIENEDHFLNHCDLNAASRRKVLDKIQSIISNQNTPSATSHPFQTVIPGTNVLKLISNNSEIIESITNESQVHLTRVVARFATTCINNRKKFVDSLANTWRSSSVMSPLSPTNSLYIRFQSVYTL